MSGTPLFSLCPSPSVIRAYHSRTLIRQLCAQSIDDAFTSERYNFLCAVNRLKQRKTMTQSCDLLRNTFSRVLSSLVHRQSKPLLSPNPHLRAHRDWYSYSQCSGLLKNRSAAGQEKGCSWAFRLSRRGPASSPLDLGRFSIAPASTNGTSSLAIESASNHQ